MNRVYSYRRHGQFWEIRERAGKLETIIGLVYAEGDADLVVTALNAWISG